MIETTLPTIPALVLCCSKAGLAVIRSLGSRGIPVAGLCYGRAQPAAASRHLRRACRCPDPNEDERGFIEFLLALGAEWQGAVVFPTDDASLVAVSRRKAELSRRYRVAAADWDVVRVLIEKRHTYELAERHGIPCPRMRVTHDEREALAFAREVGFPCLLKPSVGHAFFHRYHAKMLMVPEAETLRRAMAELADYDAELMLCEFIPGDETCGVTYNSYCDEGRPRHEFTAQKLRLKPRLIGFPTAIVGRWLPEVAAAGRQVLAALGYSGFSCTEFKRDPRDGVYKLMEVNARPNYSGWLAVNSGRDFPYLGYLAATGAEPAGDGRHAAPQTDGICWIDEERDAKDLLAAVRGGRGALWSHLEPYRGRHVFAVWSAADPLPAARQLADTLQHAAAFRPRKLPQDARAEHALMWIGPITTAFVS